MKRYYGIANLISIICIVVTFSILCGCHKSDKNLNESFLRAIYAKDYSLIDKLLKEGVDINASLRDSTSTPLAEAASVGDMELINYLLSKGAKVEGTKSLPNLPIFIAISGGHTAVVSRFLDLGVDSNYAWPNRDGGTLLISAVQFGELDIVKLLVQRGADINFCGNGNFSPLYRSIIYDHFSVFKFLLSKGVCLNEQDLKALSEVEWEKVKSDKKYIELLKKKGCPILPTKGKNQEKKKT